MANHNGSRRVNGVRCAVYAACATKQERRRTWTVTHSYLHLLRTNERTNGSFLWSRGIVATLSQRRMRRATGVRDPIEIQLQNYFRGRPRSPWTNFHSAACVRTGPRIPLPGHPATARKAQLEEKVFLSRE